MKGDGSPRPSNDQLSPASQRRRDRIARSQAAIAGYLRGLETAVDEIGDQEAFIARWLAAARAEDNGLAALERQFERIVNEWQDAIFDSIEREAAEQGSAPEPPEHGRPDDADRWNAAALQMGVISSAAAPGEAPGRWPRYALLGFIGDGMVGNLRDLSAVRQLFSHRYSQAEDDEKGREVWTAIDQLRELVPEVTRAAHEMVERLWPESAG
jgi:hypothetical protein